MTDVERYVEKAAETLFFARGYASPPWERRPDTAKDAWRGDARAVLTAVLPDIRLDVGEEIARAIERDAGMTASGVTTVAVAAQIARAVSNG